MGRSPLETHPPSATVVEREATTLTWPRRSDDAFSEVLTELRTEAGLHGRPAGDALARLVTIGGRLPFAIGIDALAPWEAGVVGWLVGREEPIFAQPDELPADRATIVATQSPLGLLSLHRASDGIPEDESAVGAFVLPDDIDEAVEEVVDEADTVEAFERAQLDEMLRGFDARGELHRVVDDLVDRVDHVESIYIYVDATLWARSDVGNTLLRQGILAALKEKPLAEWTPAERLFAAAAHVLYASGRSIRFEEFNGRTLTASRLRQWLVQRLLVYSAAVGEPVASGMPSEPLDRIAERVRTLRAKLEDNGAFGFRRIHGLTLVKQEHVRRLEDFPHEPEELSPLVAGLADEWDLRLDADAGPYENVADLADVAVRAKAADPESDATEILLERIVLADILTGQADYGMSSSMRDLRRLRPSDDGRPTGVLELQKPDFFCVCLPHPALVDAVAQDLLFEMLNAVALRMQFNRWHFIAGNFERDEIPTSRHFFYPPVMPDIAKVSEARHAGHTLAWVRYSVRAPGPQLWRAPLEVFGNAYRGCFDTRLVRLVEPPLTRHEMAISSRHTALMDAFWRTAARLVESGAVDAPIVTGFDRTYYADEVWRRATEAVVDLDDAFVRDRLRPRRLRT